MLVVAANHKALRTPVRALLDWADEPPDGFFVNIHDRAGALHGGPRDAFASTGAATSAKRCCGHIVPDLADGILPDQRARRARSLLQLVLAEVGQAGRVLDLYSGSGLFAVPLAQRGARVVAVEENRQAMQDAEANLRLNKIPPEQVRLVAGRVEDALPRLQAAR